MRAIPLLVFSCVLAGGLAGCFDRDLSGKPCDGDHPCLDGFVCAAGTCLPPGEGCLSDADCTLPETCNASARCEDPDPDCEDVDGDRHGLNCLAGDDCDDADPAAFTAITAFVDADLDGVGTGPAVTLCTDGQIPAGHAAADTDCDDTLATATIFVTAFVDADLDGVGAGPAVTLCTDGQIPAGHAATDSDCDDAIAGAVTNVSAFVDADLDGVGAGDPVTICTDGTIPPGHATSNTDCDDTVAGAVTNVSAFVDGDRDGVGAGAAVTLCTDGTIPVGHSSTATDCDDGDATVFISLAGFVDEDGDGIGAGPSVSLCTAGAIGAGQSATTGDNCPATANADQRDEDNDGVGDACDNCPVDANAGQENVGETGIGGVADGVGDLCDPRPTGEGDTVALFDGVDSLSGWQAVSGNWIQNGAGLRQNTSNGDGFLRKQGFNATNQRVEGRVIFGFQADDAMAVTARVDGANDGYACVMNRDLDRLQLRLLDNGVLAGVLTETAQASPPLNTPFVLRLEVVGTALQCTLVGGVTVAATNAVHSTGTIGFATTATRATAERVVVYGLGG